MPTLWTIGYETLQPGPLAAELMAAGVGRVVDVRYRPQSRRPGMSKTRLQAFFGDRGLSYEHRRALGTPADLRALYRSGRIEEARAAYRLHAEAHAADSLDELAAELASPACVRTALLCLEADPSQCHRSVVAECLRARLPGLDVIDL